MSEKKINLTQNFFRIAVTVKPKSSRQKITADDEGKIKIFLNSPPESGKANEELLSFLSKKLRISQSSINIVNGLKSRIKVLELTGISEADFKKIINCK
ncbi:MAG TPA: DUF167 domain-containing protein, partial [Victivallales bacterium]|nr:DUF167 domain-containing protein [Victivallales bacterium]